MSVEPRVPGLNPTAPGLNPTAADVLDAKQLRRTFGSFATGVTVVTTGGADPHAMTANSFASVSLDPPLVLVCVGREAIMHGRLDIGFFGVSVLSAHQEKIARHFADGSRALGLQQFDGIECDAGPVTGVPMIADALARFECELWNSYDGGDHTIFLGRLLSMDRPALDRDEALVFHLGRFRQIAPRRDEVTA